MLFTTCPSIISTASIHLTNFLLMGDACAIFGHKATEWPLLRRRRQFEWVSQLMSCDRIVSRPRILTWMRRTFAVAFAVLGAKLALAER